ncbi:MAG: hypothetical protein ABJA67_09310 [Chthonomonadales bacterium]
MRAHFLALLCLAAASHATAQTPPLPGTPGQTPPGGGAPQRPGAPTAPGQNPIPPGADKANITYEELTTDGSRVQGRNVSIELGEYLLTAGSLEGDWDHDLIFTDNPRLTFRGQTITGDSIRFNPKTKAYSVTNLHSTLTPDFLQSKITKPVYASAAVISGRKKDPVYGTDAEFTTCALTLPHYFIRARGLNIEPGKRVILRKASVFLWGVKLITLPTLVIPLDQDTKRFRVNHLPLFGKSQEEGYFVKQTFNTLVANRVPGIIRLDLMQKKGIGIGTDQAYNYAKAAGLFAIYAIPTGGTAKNLTGRLNHRQNIGGGETFTLDNEYQKNSYLALPSTTNQSNRFGFTRLMGISNTTFNFSKQSSSSSSTQVGSTGATTNSSYSSSTITSTLAQTLNLTRNLTMNFGTDYTHYQSQSPNFGSAAATGQSNEQLNTKFQATERASNYQLELNANKRIPVGQQTQQSFFGGVEKLPEVTLSNYRFTQGLLSKIPATFLVSAGKYSEGSSGFGTTSSGVINTERVVTGIDIQNTRYSLSPRTDLNIAGGFQQYLYGLNGTAQFIVRNNTTLSQRFGHKSGVNINYSYQQPEGGTPFRFDQQGKFHALNADAGMLDDRRFQVSARVGYDLAGNNFGGTKTPWQSLSTNVLYRPVDWARMRNLVTFDPNTGKVISSTIDLRLRGHNDFSFDTVGKYDPQRHKFGQISNYLNLPIGRDWRIIGLFQYNGYLSRFESRSIQVTKDLHCLEAVFTYIDNPFGFRSDKQVYFTLRIKGLPQYQAMGVGQFGQAIDTSLGGDF